MLAYKPHSQVSCTPNLPTFANFKILKEKKKTIWKEIKVNQTQSFENDVLHVCLCTCTVSSSFLNASTRLFKTENLKQRKLKLLPIV